MNQVKRDWSVYAASVYIPVTISCDWHIFIHELPCLCTRHVQLKFSRLS